MIRRFIVLLLPCFLALSACEPARVNVESYGTNAMEAPEFYFSTMNELHIEVAYEPGAEPYVGTSLGQPLWHFLKANMEGLFEGREIVPTVRVPTELSEMEVLPEQNRAAWSAQDIFELANVRRHSVSTASNSYFFVLFLNGYFQKEDGSTSTQTLGVQLTDSTIVAIFKPVIVSTGSGQPPFVAKYIEQSTLVHEMGHALGLVNNGLPMKVPHQDKRHSAHCTNSSCTMYWRNEGPSEARDFALKYILTGGEIIFGKECLRDTREYKP